MAVKMQKQSTWRKNRFVQFVDSKRTVRLEVFTTDIDYI